MTSTLPQNLVGWHASLPLPMGRGRAWVTITAHHPEDPRMVQIGTDAHSKKPHYVFATDLRNLTPPGEGPK